VPKGGTSSTLKTQTDIRRQNTGSGWGKEKNFCDRREYAHVEVQANERTENSGTDHVRLVLDLGTNPRLCASMPSTFAQLIAWIYSTFDLCCICCKDHSLSLNMVHFFASLLQAHHHVQRCQPILSSHERTPPYHVADIARLAT
jgi:hypothetical protein